MLNKIRGGGGVVANSVLKSGDEYCLKTSLWLLGVAARVKTKKDGFLQSMKSIWLQEKSMLCRGDK